jgi:hypothetical protein
MDKLIKNLDFAQLCDHFGFFDRDLIALLEVDKRTLKNWRKNNKAPQHIRKLVTIVGKGYLPADSDWSGFSVRGDILYTPLGQELSSGEILSWFYRSRMISSYKAVNRRLLIENERLKRLSNSANSVFKIDGSLKQLKLL